MHSARLTFLYPPLFRTIRVAEGAAANASRSSSPSSTTPCRGRAPAEVRLRGYAAFAPTTGARQSGFAPRHGKGVEPVTKMDETTVGASKGDAISGLDPKTANTTTTKTATTATGTTAAAAATPSQTAAPGEDNEAGEAKAAKQEARDQAKKSGPLEAILHMGPPEEAVAVAVSGAGQRPHMAPPPYVHHFDSYSLVKDLERGGYSKKQAITLMKAIRALLAHNLDVAQESLVSKSDVENETYLFRAACSELSTEVKNNQKLADEEMRQRRTLLQHEVDILAQSLNQELLTLNDNVRGMFNDRKMAVREEQKAGDSVIQQINYKISLHLSSDAKSEIEGLRWILIRRSVIGILFMAVLTLGTLRYGTYVSHARQAEAERLRKQAEMLKMADGKRDHSSAPDAAEILAAN
ncbi:MOZ protein represents a chromatin-associated acetyltransferase [Colletotrichum graminicola]|uniref:MOZ protein represents a chromatin-associated acetyltransferase n=1 Tax=Colletotrichum graminicola (strain M1.001 / M2 / FGSC 10212) TaxID=645133 RepID=E3Q2M9_COLGM|nr:MOZ protein represents a chromatin-associated acetyltransferase [Colletotrichum graminicola M1.001]EFQ24858.1 MOZ protein represents a chromatin-associated acetyltransferase [Colletotrichum graminicola M1.001]WDK15622.1 MOZ protein represents a chromatin-associated acetyltransferase [Colletotrichum graminicola]